jgi:hypothetical protein
MVDGVFGQSCSVLLSEEYWRRETGADEGKQLRSSSLRAINSCFDDAAQERF